MGIMDRLEQQYSELNEQQRILELLSDLHGRLDGIERNQKEVVGTTNASTQSIIKIWRELERLQPQPRSDESANASSEKALRILGNTQREILDLLSSTKSMKLPDGSSISAADLSAHALMQTTSAEIRALSEMSSSLADELHRRRVVSIDYEKLATFMVPRLAEQLTAQERAVQAAWAEAAAPVLRDLENSRAALREAGAQVSVQMKRAGEQVGKLKGTITWHTVGQVGAALLPFALVTFVVFGLAQTLWAAFGLEPILQSTWAWFMDTPEWQGRLAIAGGAFGFLGAFGLLIWSLGKKLHRFYGCF